MTDRIVDVIQITPATDWFFRHEFDASWGIEDFEPVMVFALVSVIDEDFTNSPTAKKLIALNVNQASDLPGLIGMDTDEVDGRPLFYKTQLSAYQRLAKQRKQNREAESVVSVES